MLAYHRPRKSNVTSDLRHYDYSSQKESESITDTLQSSYLQKIIRVDTNFELLKKFELPETNTEVHKVQYVPWSMKVLKKVFLITKLSKPSVISPKSL